MKSPIALPRVFVYGLATNAVWEFVQCVVFYDMWGWSISRAALWMAGATLADGVLVLGIVALASRLLGGYYVWPPKARGWAVLILIGFMVGIAVEWVAQIFQWWKYGPLMPLITLFGYTLGVTPLLQMALLPGLSAHLAALNAKQSSLD